MSVTLTARAIAEKALQLIGAFSPNDTAADGDDLARALSWLDMEVAHLAGTQRLQFLVEDSLVIALNANETSRTLADLLSGLQDIDMQFPVAASLTDSTGREYPVTVVRVDQYEAISNKDDTGKPHTIYIDRQKEPTVYFYPTTSETGLSLRLTFVRFAPDLTDEKGNVATLMRPAWNKWTAAIPRARISAPSWVPSRYCQTAR